MSIYGSRNEPNLGRFFSLALWSPRAHWLTRNFMTIFAPPFPYPRLQAGSEEVGGTTVVHADQPPQEGDTLPLSQDGPKAESEAASLSLRHTHHAYVFDTLNTTHLDDSRNFFPVYLQAYACAYNDTLLCFSWPSVPRVRSRRAFSSEPMKSLLQTARRM